MLEQTGGVLRVDRAVAVDVQVLRNVGAFALERQDMRRYVLHVYVAVAVYVADDLARAW